MVAKVSFIKPQTPTEQDQANELQTFLAAKRVKEQIFRRATERYSKARRIIMADEPIQIAFHQDKHKASEILLQAAVMFEIAGRELQELAEIEEKEKQQRAKTKRNSKSR